MRVIAMHARLAAWPCYPSDLLGLYQRLTVTENLEYFARLYGLPRRQDLITEALAADRRIA